MKRGPVRVVLHTGPPEISCRHSRVHSWNAPASAEHRVSVPETESEDWAAWLASEPAPSSACSEVDPVASAGVATCEYRMLPLTPPYLQSSTFMSGCQPPLSPERRQPGPSVPS